MTNITINNGARLPVEFGDYSGEAGVVERIVDGETATIVAFFGKASRFRRVESGSIDGKPFDVVTVESSDPAKGGVAGMVRLTCRAAGGAEA